MRYFVPLLAATLLIAGGGLVSLLLPASEAKSSTPNVVVILVDTLRPEFLDLYGYEHETAPFLTQLGKRSTVFDRALSTSSWTAPSTASVFTSLYPYQHGVVQGFYAHRNANFDAEQRGTSRIPLTAISDSLTTMPELFKAAGYATFGIAANRNIDKELGFKQGFDHFEQKNDVTAEYVYQKLRGWRRDIAKASPYFLYVHLMDPHSPYWEYSPHFERFRASTEDKDKARYLSELRYVDHWIERIYKMFRLDKNTLLLVISDHGEEFGDHGSTQHGPFLYEELQRMLFLVHGPGSGIAPRRVAANVSQVDVLPTLAEFAGVATPPQAQGVSLWPLIRGEQSGEEPRWAARTLMGHRINTEPPFQENWSASRGPWKYIEHFGRPHELFDHRNDRAEQHNVAAQYADVVGELSAAVKAAREAPRDQRGLQVQVPIDQHLEDQLKSLGYVR